MLDVRDQDGRFLGVVDAEFPHNWHDVTLPVRKPFVATFDAMPPLHATFETVRLSFAQWHDGGKVSDVLRLSSGTVEQFERASHVIAAGATCRTKYGEWADQIEMLVRLFQMLRFVRMDVDNVSIH